jgi:hypothetical protein
MDENQDEDEDEDESEGELAVENHIEDEPAGVVGFGERSGVDNIEFSEKLSEFIWIIYIKLYI